MLSSFIFFLLYLIIDMKYIDETLEKRPSISSDDFRHEDYNISLYCVVMNILRVNNNN